MTESTWLADRFQENQTHLLKVAYRMLGSRGEAEDAVQETWLRLSRSDAQAVENLGGWLTTVVARVCLDMLRSRKSRREETPDKRGPDSFAGPEDPEAAVLLADAVGPALLVVLETLAPVERVAFVLHDLFDLPFAEIAPIVGRSEMATRQLASRARRRVQGRDQAPVADLSRQREVVSAFLAASRDGNFEALVALLDPDVVLRADQAAIAAAAANQGRGAPTLAAELRGASAVADCFRGRARAARLALIDGAVGAAWAPGGTPRVVFAFAVEAGKIAEIELVMEPVRLGELAVELLGEWEDGVG
jgi:RNA polymerase sigma-70 factor (ECF subfamily)